MRSRRRVNGGRVEACESRPVLYDDDRWLLAQVAAVFLAGIVLINLPIVPGTAYARGGATAMLITAFF